MPQPGIHVGSNGICGAHFMHHPGEKASVRHMHVCGQASQASQNSDLLRTHRTSNMPLLPPFPHSHELVMFPKASKVGFQGWARQSTSRS